MTLVLVIHLVMLLASMEPKFTKYKKFIGLEVVLAC